MLYGDTCLSKSSHVIYLESFLQQYSPECKNKWVVLDQGGELYGNPDVCNLFTRYNYTIYPTGGDSSSQNGPVERAHHTVSNGIKSCLIGAGLPIAYWPFAFFKFCVFGMHSPVMVKVLPLSTSQLERKTI